MDPLMKLVYCTIFPEFPLIEAGSQIQAGVQTDFICSNRSWVSNTSRVSNRKRGGGRSKGEYTARLVGLPGISLFCSNKYKTKDLGVLR